MWVVIVVVMKERKEDKGEGDEGMMMSEWVH